MLDSSRAEVPLNIEEQPLDPLHYWGILRKRKFYGLIPFVCVLAIGGAAAMLWPPTFLSEGKILIESQQIPVDLVKPTVTSPGAERIAIIQQRVMTRENLLRIADKYQLFSDERDRLSRTDLLDKVRANIVVKQIQYEAKYETNSTTIAITVGYMDRKPDVATKMANELLTLFLDEDARNRTTRATETTKFLAQEAEKLKVELASIDAKILEGYQTGATTREGAFPELMSMKAELAAKSGIYSNSHPEIKRLKAQIAAMEKGGIPVTTQVPAATIGQTNKMVVNPLVLQRMSVQENLERTSEKLAAAQLGENLERDQYSARLQILEQAIPPQKPIKPERPKLIALAFIGSLAAGLVGIWVIESIDRTIRGSNDLLAVANGQLIVAIPYIATKAELSKKKNRVVVVMGVSLTILLAGLAVAHFFIRPLDELWAAFIARLF
jgi:uncharacterized protein involved in exopolysaccharide biosynthesis